MKIQISHSGCFFRADLSLPIDISIPLIPNADKQVNCFFAPPLESEPVRSGGFVGSVSEGGAVNFMNVRLNPHGNGTHTECVGHISKLKFTLPNCMQNSHFVTRLVSLDPLQQENGDRMITRQQIESLGLDGETRSLIIRTLPNDEDKKWRNYSGKNPPFVHHEAIICLVESGIEHLLIDLPSIDREEDGGKLLGHRAYWKYPENPRSHATITELVYVPDSVEDGLYLVDIQISALALDASPSRPLLFELVPIPN